VEFNERAAEACDGGEGETDTPPPKRRVNGEEVVDAAAFHKQERRRGVRQRRGNRQRSLWMWEGAG
jgi:hypothetical protein